MIENHMNGGDGPRCSPIKGLIITLFSTMVAIYWCETRVSSIWQLQLVIDFD